MKVFICWSGARSQAVAQILRSWMPLVLHFVKPWLSDLDIAAGERWAQSVAKELESTNFGIACLTRENVTSPWILFEAGSLAKLLGESKLIPLLLDLEFRDITGPLAQFQAKKADKEGLNEVIQSINQTANEPIPDERIKELFEALWPKFEEQLGEIPQPSVAPKQTRPQHEVLEELVAGVRSLDSRLRDAEDKVSSPDSTRFRRFRHKFHPMMLEDILHMSFEPSDPIGILFAASVVRDDIPWFYEIALEIYHAIMSGDNKAAEKQVDRLHRLSERLMHGPFMEELGSKEMHMFMMEYPRMLEHMALRCIRAKKTPARPKASKTSPTK